MSNVDIYTDVVTRIQNVYKSCDVSAQHMLKQILKEISKTGDSPTLENLWLADFKEVPVSIDEFICNPEYLGNVTRNGEAVYPFWRKTVRDIFDAGNTYNEIILSGATRIGKTSTAVLIASYMLYRLMLYKDPHSYFHKKQISKFTIAFANLTMDLAEGVAYREFNDTLRESPWFNEHGKFSRSQQKFYYMPEGDKINILAGSSSAHLLGMQIWCLVGDTKILTDTGWTTLSDAASNSVHVMQLTDDNEFVSTEAKVALTKYVSTTVKITLNNGGTIEGTPEHKIMMADRSYKTLRDITQDDVILSFSVNDTCSHNCEKIATIEEIKYENPIPVYDVIDVRPNHNFAILSGSTIIISHNCAIMDETNFAKAGVKDLNIAKQSMKALYDTVNARVSGTFRLNGEVYGKLLAVSSKNSDSDFLSGHIDSQLSSGNKHLFLVDEPQWRVLPPSMFSQDTFYFTVGDRYKRGFVVPDENCDKAHLADYESQGYQVVEAPAEFKSSFLADYDIALRDIAGISVVGAFGFITQELITPNISTERRNPFYTDTIVIGREDNATIEQFFHLEAVDPSLRSKIMHIHLDAAEVSDRFGISGVCIDGLKTITDAEGRKVSSPFFRHIFSVGLKAPNGDRISFQKVVNFLIWLRRSGFNIRLVSTDQYQSTYLREVLEGQGFATEKISVDASDEPYIGLRSLLQDQLIELVKCQLAEDEMVKLQRIGKRIDHPPGGSKDVSDSITGACWTLLTHHAQPQMETSSLASIISKVNSPSRKIDNAAKINTLFGNIKRY